MRWRDLPGLFLILGFGVAGVSCEMLDYQPPSERSASDRWGMTHPGTVLKRMQYIQDKDTGLCFAYGGHSHGAAFAHVPCSEAVMKKINANRS